MNMYKKILFRFIGIMLGLFVISTSGTCLAATSNLVPGAITEFGMWLNESNRDLFVADMSNDLDKVETSVQRHITGVPIEAKLGMAFMNAMSRVSKILDSTLFSFAIVFIIVLYAFWVMLESYNMVNTGQNIMKFAENLVKKGALIAVWIIVIRMGPEKIFMYFMGPVLSVGTAISNIILNTTISITGMPTADTCTAIQQYALANADPSVNISPQMIADIMCLPSRMSGMFNTAIHVGFQWIKYGLGHSLLTVIAGVIFVCVFAISIWKFALMALGVVADLFMALFMLPFTAVSETINKTSYKGIPGTVYNGFAGLFNANGLSLDAQISKFINASIYFVSLSVVISLCYALMSGTILIEGTNGIPSLQNTGFMVTLMAGCLILHLANKAEKLAQDLGGSINYELGTKFGDTVTKLGKDIWDTGRSWDKAIRGK